ncbi:MAG: 2-amino-4-hydroxy-6-hydroxymethyldihydropteridine pyrophosphokinae [Caulobacteraceae bacterium]|nr:2-amino-4-hydroxy-6-hydroxymethyldihydropteridine pyrophosphokinae [Caulobacteraceae bacterium]
MDQPINADQLAVIALGGNLPGENSSVAAALQAAVERLPALGFEPVRVSRWWRSAAWPDPSDPPFLNGVVLARTALSAVEALAALHRLEAGFGRERASPNAPRTLDLDLIALGRQIVDSPALALPHPRAADRYFVMAPLAEIAPHWRHPVLNATAQALAQTATIGRDAVPQ